MGLIIAFGNGLEVMLNSEPRIEVQLLPDFGLLNLGNLSLQSRVTFHNKCACQSMENSINTTSTGNEGSWHFKDTNLCLLFEQTFS
jgi:hypothetical protein